MRGRLWLSLGLVVVLLSGCADVPEDGAPGTGGSGGGGGSTGMVDAPEWEIGRYWDYQTMGEASNGQSLTLVVSGEEGSDWIMDTTDTDVAYHHAMTGGVSYLEKIRKSDVAGSQGSDRVKFFDFPLEDGKSWSTRWDGFNVQVTAELVDEGKFDLVAMDGDRVHAEYAYDAEVGFFTEAKWPDDNGTVQWGIELTDSGNGFSGTLVRYGLGDPIAFVHGAQETGLYEEEFADQWNEIGLRAVLACNEDPGGIVAVGVNSPEAAGEPVPMLPAANEPEEGRTLDCGSDQALVDAWLMQNPGGTWEFGFIVSAPNAVAHLFLEPRAREEIAFSG